MKNKATAFIATILLVSFSIVRSQSVQNISILADKPTVAVSPNMWGIFFEDINFSADGGLYAELVKNRSFEFSTPMMGWKEIKKEATGRILITNRSQANTNNPRFAKVYIDAKANGFYGLDNEGFRGMGIYKDEQYNFSFLAKLNDNKGLKLKLQLVNAKGNSIGEATLTSFTKEWKKYSVSFKATETEEKASLQLLFEGSGQIDVDLISLFPQHTWKERPGGLRKDLVEKLAALKPGFLRFPGGCIVEGRDLLNRYQWKETVGKVDDRKLLINRWNTEFSYRSTPDYFQSFGLGFYEYFQLCDDLGASPLPILNCGMACQYNSKEVVAMDELDPYIKDALDLIEFANGSITSKWGKLRAAMGHPKPFNLKMMGVGNEQWAEQYAERFKAFEKALKAKYPTIKLIAAAGPSPNGKDFDFAWKELKDKADFMDEHYYASFDWFLKNASRYDNYDRKTAKVFAGEYAAHGKDGKEPESKNTWYSALCEAAFMTGLERNADVVSMASYAPLMAHVDAWQWRPDLIWFNNLTSIATPNYWVQKAYSNYKGTTAVPALIDGKIIAGKDSLYSSAVIDKMANALYIKIANTSPNKQTIALNIQGFSAASSATIESLFNKDLYAFNTLEKPTTVQPLSKQLSVTNNQLSVELEANSFSVIIVPFKK